MYVILCNGKVVEKADYPEEIGLLISILKRKNPNNHYTWSYRQYYKV